MKNKINVNTFLFVITLLLLFLLNSFQAERPAFSEIENRALKQKPVFTWESLLSGTYFVEFENYFADTFIYREPLSKISRSLENLTGWRGEDQVQLVVHHGENYGDALLPQDQPIIQDYPEDSSNHYSNDSTLDVAENERINDTDYNNETETESKMETSPAKQTEGQSKEQTEGPEIKSQENDSTDHETKVEEDQESENTADKVESEPQDDFQQIVGRILLMRDKAMNLYKFSEAAGDAYAKLINQFADQVAKQEVDVYSLLAPTQIEFVESSQYKELSAPQNETLAFVNKRLESPVTAVNAYTALQEHAEEYLYFRTDHHWTARGAYYAYQAFMKASDRNPIALDDYETQYVEGFLGSTYAATLSQSLEKNPDTIELFQPFIPHEYHVYYEGALKMDVLDMNHADKKNKYRIFLSGDRPWGKITTEAKSEDKIAVFKDSYANAFVPFLIPHYREIYIIDPRQYENDIFELITENQIDEVLFMTNMGVTSHQGFTNLLKEMIDRNEQPSHP